MTTGTAVATGRALKDAGQQLALDLAGDWRDRVTDEFRAWATIQKARGIGTFVMEEFRAQARNHPHSHKAWGALPGVLRAAELIAADLHPDGSPKFKLAAAPKTHAHPVRVWRFA